VQEARIKEGNAAEMVAAVAIGQLKESRRFELTKTILESSSYEKALQFLSRADLAAAQSIIERCKELNLLVVPITSPRYPGRLREISAPPVVLYIQTLDHNRLMSPQTFGVVGTRSASIEVCRRSSEIAKDLATAGITVVSGLALGIDGAAHRGALDSKIECATIAVLAHGLDRVYPPSHLGLAREIVNSGGMIISEYAPGVEPLKHHFLARNRIIAGLSRGVLVVQAGARSGSLVTANFAADYGRDVFVFDDSVGGDASSGGSSLIDQGAIAVRSARDILAEYGLAQSADILSDESAWTTTTLETFLSVTKLSSRDLLKLELAGLLVRLPGNQVRVRN
jgi:DNA protecting protein DprA